MPANSSSLRIATWNLEDLPVGSTKADLCREKIDEIKADVWVFTEAPQKFDLEDKGYGCIATSESASDLPEAKRWVKVFVKLPVVNKFSQGETKDTQRTVCAQGELQGALEVIIYGTVLPWLGDKRKKQETENKDVFSTALEEQSQEWSKLNTHYSDALLIVAGDFNQDLLEEGHFYGSSDRREALKKALDQAKLQCFTGGRSDPIASNAPGNANIDHICVRAPKNRTVQSVSTSAWTLVHNGSRISDHFGLYLDIILD